LNKRLQSLFFLCQCLKPETSANDVNSIRDKIQTGSVNWEGVVELAHEHFVITALWSGLVRKGLDDSLPDDLRFYLGELHRMNHVRNDAIRSQVADMLGHLNSVNVSPLLLKGAALLFAGMFEDPAARIMVDIDLMVREEQVEKVLEVLSSTGYSRVKGHSREDSLHLPPVVKNGLPASVEVHTRIFDKWIDVEILNSSEVWGASMLTNMNGVTFHLMSPSQWTLYNIAHSEIHRSNFRRGSISLRDLLDFSVILSRYTGSIDWREIKVKMESKGLEKLVRAYLYMGSRLFGTVLPSDLQPRLSSFLHFTRCLGQVSLPILHRSMTAATIVYGLFRAKELQGKYGCSNAFLDVTRARFRYLMYLLPRYVLGSDRVFLWRRLSGKGVADLKSRVEWEEMRKLKKP